MRSRSAGVDFEIVQGDFTEEVGRSGDRGTARSRRTFDAVFAANDMMAIGALQALRARGHCASRKTSRSPASTTFRSPATSA